MPPILRSSSRVASRAASQARSRPQTPRGAPSGSQSASLSGPARPQKQLKTGRQTKSTTAVAADSGRNRKRKIPNSRSNRSANGQEDGDTTDTPEYVEEPWIEPPLRWGEYEPTVYKQDGQRVELEERPFPYLVRSADRRSRSTGKFPENVNATTTSKRKITSTSASEQPEQSDTPRLDEQGDQTDPVTTRTTSTVNDDVPSDTASANNNAIRNDAALVNDTDNFQKDAAAVNNINNVSKDASPVIEDKNIQNDAAPVSDINNISKDTFSVNDNKNIQNDAATINNDNVSYNAVPVNGQEPADGLAPPAQFRESLTLEKVREIIDAAITRAEGYEDPRVADGLRQIRADSGSDPFLLSVVGSALTKQDGSIERAAFEKILREAVRRSKAATDTQNAPSTLIAQPGPSATGMARTQSGISSSSLSTAKSVSAPAIIEEVEETPEVTATRANAQPTRGRGGKRGGRGGSRSTAKSRAEKREETKKKRKQDDEHAPELTNEAIEIKKKAYKKTLVPNVVAEEVNERQEDRPPRPDSIPPVTREWSPETQFTDTRPEIDPETDPRNHYKPRARAEEIDNNDYCDVCNGGGELLCCDSCVKSFHFGCLNPKLDPKNPPEGEWHCSTCSKEGVFGSLTRLLEVQKPVPYRLPKDIRTFYKDVHTGSRGNYVEAPDLMLHKRERPKKMDGLLEFRLRVTDRDGKLILCARCGKTSREVWPLLQCDFCPDYWHMDCLDPPLTTWPAISTEDFDNLTKNYDPNEPIPHPKPFKCPNHSVEEAIDESMPYSLGRFRRPRHPKYKDIDVIPDDESIRGTEEEEDGSEVTRVKEKGVVTAFINKVKNGRIERKERLKAYHQRSKARVEAAELASLDPTERQAIVGLVNLGNVQPTTTDSDRHGHLVSQLVASAPESARTSTDELGILRDVQALLNQRVDDLVGQSTN